MDNRKYIAIIPARSGSKGLSDKNVRILNGKPLLAYTVEAARNSGIFETVHVSTDSEEYSAIAEKYGANQDFLRDPENAADASSSWDVVREVIHKYEKQGKRYDTCVLLQPTSPLRTAGDIRKACMQYGQKGVRSVVSVTETDHPVQWCFPLTEDCAMTAFALSPYRNMRRQELSKQYRENGAIYIVSVKDIMQPDFDIYAAGCYAYIMDPGRSIDIDTLTDLRIAEVLLRDKAGECEHGCGTGA